MMRKMIVHVQPDGSVRLEGLAPGRPVPKGLPVVDAKDIPGKQDTLVWKDGKLAVDPQRLAAWQAKDRRGPMEKLVDQLIGDGVVPASRKDEILGR